MSKEWESGIDLNKMPNSKWQAEFHGISARSTSIRIFDGNRTVGMAVGVGHDDNRIKRESRLMAAAPELLDACVAALGMCDGSGILQPKEVAGMLESAIAKAEGKTP